MIPIARSLPGVLVLPSCSNDEGPFTCLGCDGELVLWKSKVTVFHFAHRRLSHGCSGGGDSAMHKAAKMLIENYCSRLLFEGQCVTGTHSLARQYSGSCARRDYRYDQNVNNSAGVAIFVDGALESVVEVRASHPTTGESLESRQSCVGVNNLWEVSAVDVLSKQTELYTTTNTVHVRSLLPYEVDECASRCRERIREAEDVAEMTRREKMYTMKRLRSPRLVGPVIEQYSALLKWNRVLDSLLWARSYHEAVEHLNSIPKWKDVGHFRVLVAHDWSLWIDNLLLNFEFGTTKRLLSHPFVASEPVLLKRKSVWCSHVWAAGVLRRVLREYVICVRWTVKKKKTEKIRRMNRQSQQWVSTTPLDTLLRKRMCLPL